MLFRHILNKLTKVYKVLKTWVAKASFLVGRHCVPTAKRKRPTTSGRPKVISLVTFQQLIDQLLKEA